MAEVYDVPYMERTRNYYRAQGYSTDYVWAHNTHTPFASLTKPMSESRVGVVTTSMPDTAIGLCLASNLVNVVFPAPILPAMAICILESILLLFTLLHLVKCIC